jgi:hypothetical protein
MNTFRQMIFSNSVVYIGLVALCLLFFFTTLGRRTRKTNLILGAALVFFSILTVSLSIRAYQLSY